MRLEQTMLTALGETVCLPQPDNSLTVAELAETEANEVLAFLSERPVHTICMVGMIRDNGLISEYNRGIFYGCRNSEGQLVGVALIGHATLIETRTREAIRELASVAQFHNRLHMIIAERDTVEDFWNYYAGDGLPMRLACRRSLFELKKPLEIQTKIEDLRLATIDELNLIAPVHAELVETESGVNPLETDCHGFLKRCARRINKKRVWVIINDNRLIFKADIQAESSDVIYLEGVYVNPQERGLGIGRRCFAQLSQLLLERSDSICVMVDAENEKARSFYRMCDFEFIGNYDVIFLNKKCDSDRLN